MLRDFLRNLLEIGWSEYSISLVGASEPLEDEVERYAKRWIDHHQEKGIRLCEAERFSLGNSCLRLRIRSRDKDNQQDALMCQLQERFPELEFKFNKRF